MGVEFSDQKPAHIGLSINQVAPVMVILAIENEWTLLGLGVLCMRPRYDVTIALLMEMAHLPLAQADASAVGRS